MRTSEALSAGIHQRVLYGMRNEGILVPLSRGVYQLKEGRSINSPDIITVWKRVPKAAVCLVSALSIHNLTLQVPHYVYLAVNSDETRVIPRVEHPPTRVFLYSTRVFNSGLEHVTLDGFSIPVYSPEKTIADCFKHRNKIGLDVALEALKLYRERKKVRVDKLLEYARICRVEKVMRPYLEAIL